MTNWITPQCGYLIKVLQDRLVWKNLTFSSLNDHIIGLGLGLKL